MPAIPVTITEPEMVAFLKSGKTPPEFVRLGGEWSRDVHGNACGQLVATWKLTSGLSVKVYTSVFGRGEAGDPNGKSAGVGEDSIRIALVDEDARRGVSKTTYTTRTVGWQDRLREKIQDMMRLALSMPDCPRCGGKMALRAQKANKKNVFWGCLRWPSCAGTREAAA